MDLFSDKDVQKRIRENMKDKDSERLKEIYRNHDKTEWQPITFKVIRDILHKRGEKVPVQMSSQEVKEAKKAFSSVKTNGDFDEFLEAYSSLMKNEEPYAWLNLEFESWDTARCLVTDKRVLLFKGDGAKNSSLSLEMELDIKDIQGANLEEHGSYSEITLIHKSEDITLKLIPSSEAKKVSNWIENNKTRPAETGEEKEGLSTSDQETQSNEGGEKKEGITIHQDASKDPSGVTRSGVFSPVSDPVSETKGEKYEYLRLQLNTQGIDSGDKKINELGRAGWELVSAFPTSSQMQALTGSGATQYVHLYFKRPLNNSKENDEQLQEESDESSDKDKDHLSKIEKLHDLKVDGAITEEEFEEKKKELL